MSLIMYFMSWCALEPVGCISFFILIFLVWSLRFSAYTFTFPCQWISSIFWMYRFLHYRSMKWSRFKKIVRFLQKLFSLFCWDCLNWCPYHCFFKVLQTFLNSLFSETFYQYCEVFEIWFLEVHCIYFAVFLFSFPMACELCCFMVIFTQAAFLLHDISGYSLWSNLVLILIMYQDFNLFLFIPYAVCMIPSGDPLSSSATLQWFSNE